MNVVCGRTVKKKPKPFQCALLTSLKLYNLKLTLYNFALYARVCLQGLSNNDV